MSAATVIDKQINNYLEQLNIKQKKAVLTVVKTFAEEQDDYDYWGDASFVAELDRRTAEYESNKAKVYTLDEMEATAGKSYRVKKKSSK
jgi:hypothetical protein